MKVLLIVPTYKYTQQYPAFVGSSDFPVGIAYVAGALKAAGHSVFGCNPNNIVGYASSYHMMRDTIIQAILKDEPEVIGLCGLCTDYGFLKDAVSVIREVRPKVQIVMGGNIITNDAEFIMKDIHPDYGILGDGEEAVVALLEEGKKLSLVPNLYYWADSELKFTGRNAAYPNWANRPWPDYEPFGMEKLLDDYGLANRLLYRYTRPEPRIMNIVTARGCPMSCTFCIHGHRDTLYRQREISDVMAEIGQLHRRYHMNVLLVLDELFAVNKERVKEFAAGVLQGKKEKGWDFDWTFQTHASAKLDEETLRLAKQAGCFMFSYGLESGSPTILKSMNKKIELPQVEEAITLARKVGLAYSANIIFGDPAETDETIAESLAFWLKHGREAFIFLSNISPYPGSKLFDDLLGTPIIPDKEGYYKSIDKGVVNMTTLPNEDYRLRLQMFEQLEHGWQTARLCDSVRIEKEDWPEGNSMAYFEGWIYRIYGKCPFCGHEILLRAMLRPQPSSFIGSGCPGCGKRIRMNLPEVKDGQQTSQ